jgi:sphingosine kinase
MKTFRNNIFPALKENSINFELIQTDSCGNAAKIIKERENLLEFNAIVIISGDGLIFEVLNAIVSRKDGEKLLRSLPIAIIPCGSGNGLLSSVFAYREYVLCVKTLFTLL